jgi:hypothetical protein
MKSKARTPYAGLPSHTMEDPHGGDTGLLSHTPLLVDIKGNFNTSAHLSISKLSYPILSIFS